MTEINHTSDYRQRRSEEYQRPPDQLDAIFKGFKAIRDANIPGLTLPQDTLDWIARIEAVKEKLPKS